MPTPPLNNTLVRTNVTLLYGSQGSSPSPLTILNLDTINTVWIGNVSNITVGGTNAIPLQPGASMSFDGSVSIYGVASASVNVAVTPGGVSYSPGSVLATLFNQGTPAGSPAFVIPSAVSLTGPFSTVTVLNMVPVSQYNSYDVTFGAFTANQGAGNGALTAKITFTWYNTGGVPVYTETWEPWSGSNGVGNIGNYPSVFGSGKMHGQFLTVTVTNIGITQMTVQYMAIFGSPRTVSDSLWRQDAGTGLAVNPGPPYTFQSAYNSPNFSVQGSANENILAQMDSVGLGISAKAFFPLSMFSGPVWTRHVQSAAFGAGGAESVLASGAGLVGGSIAGGAAQAGIIVAYANAAGDQTPNGILVNAPHAPMALIVTNGTPGAVNLTYIAVAKEGQ